ncbi:CRISPR-associated endonuclease Csn1 [Tenacibaculum gallaicum]|uniref:CRISPR-associated endonuclease Cas9 n=1 Tax=Tenacibaculum gallaicum TaxID=561505 RepID=A0A3E0HVT2_9FLAO|nr:type II CRISPR RNA-guided endonuclease Cas9 [Tenacibaculum gallaicum]REH50622.1 CRISPR-associated endonuclease Csn1 [Tenacibaculum gallaicum]
MTKKILGLDLGTNSIGWALVESDFEKKEGKVIDNGVRIIPMDKGTMNNFGTGQSISQTADRTAYRGVRRLYERDNLRRDRLHRVLNILQFLPDHYANTIDFKKQLGQFKKGQEVKLNYRPNPEGKDEFIFQKSFLEMVTEFKKEQPQLFYTNKSGRETKIPYDWTIYYLRKKALTQKIEKEELAWLLLNFNQKRGYYQLRGEEEENSGKNEEFYALKVVEIEETQDKNAKGVWYNVQLENGFVYKRQSKESLDSWIGKVKEFIVTTQLEKDGKPKLDKEGNIKRSFRMPKEDDWNLVKKKTEQDINNSNKTVGAFIYDFLLKNPSQKVNGKLIKTIERKYYKEELEKILKTQIGFHTELKDTNLYIQCVKELYSKNEAHQNNICSKKKDEMFRYLFMDDIIFYQRPLKSKKSNIASCPYENRVFIKEGEKITQGLKVISKSHPYFIEFRLWQFIHNLKIYKIGEEKDIDVTSQFLATEKDVADLYDFLNDKKEIEQKNIIKYFIDLKKIDKKEKDIYRWNYVVDKKYPMNPTRNSILTRLKKVRNINVFKFLTSEIELQLWHIIYSVTDKKEFETALGNFAMKQELDKNSFVEAFKKHPPYSSDYGAYSGKAIKKILPLMRRGKYWNEKTISEKVKDFVSEIYERIKHLKFENIQEENLNKAIELVSDDAISKQFIKSFLKHSIDNPLTGLNTYQACYAVYQRHSEASLITQWKIPKDIDSYLEKFRQHSLKNPIVEQVALETLRTVRDIWRYNLSIDKEFKFSEIHVELGRDIKNSKDKRKRISQKQNQNENTNNRVKLLLEEMYKDGARSYSPSHQEILKIYEEGVTQNPQASYNKVKEDEIEKIKKNTNPSATDIKRYKLWLEQGYISPYTGKPISISKLFTHEYQIEHIIPQSRYFDDSFSNKVICEASINEDKSNKTAYEYLKAKGGSIVHGIKLLTLSEYENHCTQYFKKNRTKLKNLLSEKIPEGFINRQLNDSRYIAKFIKGILSNIVREEGEKEATSKNLISVSGAITSKLKHDWGLNEQWNKLIQPRFERLNLLNNSNQYGYLDYQKDREGNNIGKQFFRLVTPTGVNKKRIDHRHHTLDAIVIACCTRDHINYITSLETERKNHKLVSKLCNLKKVARKRNGNTETIEVFNSYKKPWENFTTDVLYSLEKTIVSFKKNTRVITKTNNKTWQWVKDKKGSLNKQLVLQIKGDNRAIRKPLHKETVYGKVYIKEKKKRLSSVKNFIEHPELIINKTIREKVKALNKLYDSDKKKIVKHLKENPIEQDGKKIDKIEVREWTKNATAYRVKLSDSFTRKQLESITDYGIQKILEKHVKKYIDENGKERFDLAFNPEGVDTLNKNIIEFNNGKKHQPIHSVRIYEEGSRFQVSTNEQNVNKTKKYVEAAKGTNLFFAVYWNASKKERIYETIPLKEVIDWQKWRAKNIAFNEPLIPIDKEKGEFLFFISPNDLVFVPTKEEQDTPSLVDFSNLSKEQVNRVYKMVSATKGECHFVSQYYSNNIISNENGSNNKNERVQLKDLNELDEKGKPKMIKSICWKLKVNRLGIIEKVER